METTLRKFLQSDALERYVKGETSAIEDSKIESYIRLYSEAETSFEEIQQNLEIVARANAVKAPDDILNKVKAEIAKETEKETPVIPMHRTARRTPWYSIAASIIALLFAGSSFLMYQKNQELVKENKVVLDEIYDLRNDIDNNSLLMRDMKRQIQELNNPETKKYVFRGNDRAKNLKTVAYINPIDKTSMIDVVTLPQISNDENYHVWAEMEDHFVSLGILDPSEKKMQEVPYMEDALGLSITIEPKNSKTSSANDAVAEIELKSENN